MFHKTDSHKRKREDDSFETPNPKRQVIDLTQENPPEMVYSNPTEINLITDQTINMGLFPTDQQDIDAHYFDRSPQSHAIPPVPNNTPAHPYVTTETPGLQHVIQKKLTMEDFKNEVQSTRTGTKYFFQDGTLLSKDLLPNLVHFGTARSCKSYLNENGNLTQVYTQSKLSHEQSLVFKNGDAVPKNAKVIKEGQQRYVITLEGKEKIPVWSRDAYAHQQKKELKDHPVVATVVPDNMRFTNQPAATNTPLSFFYRPFAPVAIPVVVVRVEENKTPQTLPPLSSPLNRGK